MHKNMDKLETIVNQINTTGSGYDILRYVCLPDLLGKDTNTILYVMGRNLARNLRITSIDDVIQFFEKVGWGQLTLLKEKRREFIFELTGESLIQRKQADVLDEYRIESGFLAEALQQIKTHPCECIEEIKKRKDLVLFNVKYSK